MTVTRGLARRSETSCTVRATSDLRGLFKGVLAGHLQMAETSLETSVFPDSRDVPAMTGLVA